MQAIHACNHTTPEALYPFDARGIAKRFRHAAIFGALPMALGFGADGSSRQPMGLCIVGGLVVAQVLTLFCTPVFYIYMEYFQERHLDKIAFFKRGEGDLQEVGAAPGEGVLSNNVPAR